MDDIHQWLEWAWARHHNPLSWYIRPFFVLLFCYFSWKRSWVGVVIVILATISSIAWFPAPQALDPTIEGYLAAELRWLSDPVLAATMIVMVVGTLWLLAASLWTRRWLYAIVLLNAMPIAKVVFSVMLDREAGWASLWPALATLIVCDLAIAAVYVYRKRRTA